MATPWNHKQACEWELCPGSLCVVDGWTTESSCVFCSNRGACRWPGKTDGPSDDASPYPTPKCDCYEGYAGPDCSEVRCRNNCSGTATQHRGDCIASFPVHYCECLAGFGGDDCSVVAIEICESSCNRDTGTCNESKARFDSIPHTTRRNVRTDKRLRTIACQRVAGVPTQAQARAVPLKATNAIIRYVDMRRCAPSVKVTTVDRSVWWTLANRKEISRALLALDCYGGFCASSRCCASSAGGGEAFCLTRLGRMSAAKGQQRMRSSAGR
eukprot:GHVT01007108.1.p1 GENE.GHVT01007108.1~~GHVT01007108.1.p1  ORF type:complete len:270 (-),score=16.48 GHVT01007108.1:1788-2597(-)